MLRYDTIQKKYDKSSTYSIKSSFMTDYLVDRLWHKLGDDVAVSSVPKAAAVGTISVVATEEHCAVLQRANGSYFISQFKTTVLPIYN